MNTLTRLSKKSVAVHNVDAEIMVLLQDWSSHENMNGSLDEEARDLGYTPSEPTNRNLARLLKATFALSISDVYGTNLFPFVKQGTMSGRIPDVDLVRAAREFALPQLDNIAPRLAICLGMATFNAVRVARGLPRAPNVDAALNDPFTVDNTQVWFQAHTGHFGQISRNRGGVDRVSQDWLNMKRGLMVMDADTLRAIRLYSGAEN